MERRRPERGPRGDRRGAGLDGLAGTLDTARAQKVLAGELPFVEEEADVADHWASGMAPREAVVGLGGPVEAPAEPGKDRPARAT